MFKINDIIIIDAEDGDIVLALFKGYINEKLCYVKPKKRFVRGGYGQTITCLVSKIRNAKP